jgi:hypothetical protein
MVHTRPPLLQGPSRTTILINHPYFNHRSDISTPERSAVSSGEGELSDLGRYPPRRGLSRGLHCHRIPRLACSVILRPCLVIPWRVGSTFFFALLVVVALFFLVFQDLFLRSFLQQQDLRVGQSPPLWGWERPLSQLATTTFNNEGDSKSSNRITAGKILAAAAPPNDQDSSLVPRSWPAWPRHRPLPCPNPWTNVQDGQHWYDRPVLKRPATQGLFYLKLCKTASSTAAGIQIRLARNLARRQPPHPTASVAALENEHAATWPVCQTRFLHGWAGPRMYRFGDRDRKASFLWTTLREPTARYVSEFFHFHVSRKDTPVDVPHLVHFLRRGRHADHHSLSWLAVHGYRYGKSNPLATAKLILQDYNFIGVTERMDESMVVLSMLLGVPLRDVLYLSTKQSGSYDAGASKDMCVRIARSNLTVGMRQHLESDEWQAYVAPEYALWRAAHASLDLTIQKLGREEVSASLARFQQAQAAVLSTCGGNVTKFPCTAEGVRIPNEETDCMVEDMGCGLDCIDRVADELGLPRA